MLDFRENVTNPIQCYGLQKRCTLDSEGQLAGSSSTKRDQGAGLRGNCRVIFSETLLVRSPTLPHFFCSQKEADSLHPLHRHKHVHADAATYADAESGNMEHQPQSGAHKMFIGK